MIFTKTGPYNYKENYSLDEMIDHLELNLPTLGELIAIASMAGLSLVQNEQGYFIWDSSPMKIGVLEGLISLKNK